jgi:hypothetical protein
MLNGLRSGLQDGQQIRLQSGYAKLLGSGQEIEGAVYGMICGAMNRVDTPR